jgi:YjbE family integral membrane protein
MEQVWVGLLQIILINIVLSGDNAVVIALACRALPAHQQKKAIFWGSFGAIVLRIALTFLAVWVLEIPFVQAAGALLLLYIAVKLLRTEEEEDKLKSGSNVREAIQMIVIADIVMSLDNVLAVAGAASGNLLLIGLGLAVSIPLIIWGSQLLMKLMHRFPVIVLIGAGLLGYTAGEMAVKDKAAGHWLETVIPSVHYVLPIALAVLVMTVGLAIGKKRASQKEGSVKTEKIAS